jgi:hypothetical protein
MEQLMSQTFDSNDINFYKKKKIIGSLFGLRFWFSIPIYSKHY